MFHVLINNQSVYSGDSYFLAREAAIKHKCNDLCMFSTDFVDDEIVVQKAVNFLRTVNTWYVVQGEFVSPITVFNNENGAYKVLDGEYTWHKYRSVKHLGQIGIITHVSPFHIYIEVKGRDFYVGREEYDSVEACSGELAQVSN